MSLAIGRQHEIAHTHALSTNANHVWIGIGIEAISNQLLIKRSNDIKVSKMWSDSLIYGRRHCMGCDVTRYAHIWLINSFSIDSAINTHEVMVCALVCSAHTLHATHLCAIEHGKIACRLFWSTHIFPYIYSIVTHVVCKNSSVVITACRLDNAVSYDQHGVCVQSAYAFHCYLGD